MNRYHHDAVYSTHTLCAALALIATLVAIPSTTNAQQTGSVVGRVTDRMTGQPIPGAFVQLIATVRSATADEHGRYSFSDVLPGRVELSVTALGYESQERVVAVEAGVSTELHFHLTATAVSLDRILVTAVGPKRSRELANAIVSLDVTPTAQERGIVGMVSLLQSRVPGVQVIQNSGATGTGMRIRIRGSSSIFLSNEPLIYVDGVRVESRNGFSIDAGGKTFSRINDINPDEIESIEIIKGPSAATLYGTEASNGVIRIATKRGRRGKTRWNFFVEQGLVHEPNRYPDNYEGVDADGNTCRLPDVAAGSCEQADVLTFTPLEDPLSSPFKAGHRHQYGASVSGGGDRVQFFLSGEWEGERGVLHLPQGAEDSLLQFRSGLPDHLLRPNALGRLSLRANVSSNVHENAELVASTGYVSSDTRLSNGSFWLPQILNSGLLGSARQEDNGGWGYDRPEEIFEIKTSQAVERFTSSLQGTWRPIPFLTTRSALGIDETSITDVSFQPVGFGPVMYADDGRRLANSIEILQYTVDLGASAFFHLNERLSSRTSVGAQYFRNVSSQLSAEGTQLVPGSESLGGAATSSARETTSESRTLGTFVEQQLGMNERLFLSAALRADDGNTFGSDFGLILYPKLGVSWVISEEPFFPGLSFLNHVRLRTAWGAAGRQPGPTMAVRTFTPRSATVGGVSVPGVSIGTAGNPGLRPERSEEIEVGIDALLLDGRLSVDATYYNKRTRDALMQRPLPPSLGVGSMRYENLSLVENEGFELSVQAEIIDNGAFNWSVDLGGSLNSNTVLELCPPDETSGECELLEPFVAGNHRVVEGYAPGGYWGVPFDGFEDSDGNGIITSDEVVLGDTAEFHGAQFPTRQALLSSDITLFERVRIAALFDYRGGHTLLNLTESNRCYENCRGLNDPDASLEEQARAAALWIPPYEAMVYAEPAWFVALRELSLTVAAPGSWSSALGMERMSLTVAGRNLFKWHGYEGLDPEVNQSGNSQFTTHDLGAHPKVQYWTVRLNVGF